MELNKNDIITLENKLEYVVADIVKINNVNYLYLINNDDNNDECALVKEVADGDNITLASVNDENEFDKILTMLAIKNKDEIIENLNNKE